MDYSKMYAIVRHDDKVLVIRETGESKYYEAMNLDTMEVSPLSFTRLFEQAPYGIREELINHRKKLSETQSKNLQEFLKGNSLTTKINFTTWW